MKKVFVILLAVLLLSMVGTVSADTLITNITEKDNETVPVILDLKNGYRITIPAAINFVAYDIEQSDPTKGREYLAASSIDIHVILLGAKQNITVNISSKQYDNKEYHPAGAIESIYQANKGAWRLNTTEGASIHYLISNSSAQLSIDGKDTATQKYKFTAGDDCFVYNNSIIADTNVSTKAYIHAAVADIPGYTVQYTDELKFVVNVTNS